MKSVLGHSQNTIYKAVDIASYQLLKSILDFSGKKYSLV